MVSGSLRQQISHIPVAGKDSAHLVVSGATKMKVETGKERREERSFRKEGSRNESTSRTKTRAQRLRYACARRADKQDGGVSRQSGSKLIPLSNKLISAACWKNVVWSVIGRHRVKLDI